MGATNTKSHKVIEARPQVSFDEIITQIYQGSLEVRPWQTFLKLLRERLHCDVAMIWLRPPESGIIPLTLWDRSTPPYNESEGRDASVEAARLAPLNVLVQTLEQRGGIFTLDEVISRDTLQQSEFYEKMMRRYDIEYALAASLDPMPGWKCVLSILNSGRKQNFGAEEKTLFSALKPHLEHALKLYAMLKQNEMEKEMYGAALDQLTIGAVTLDGRGKVIDTNQAARHFLQNSAAMRLIDDTLVFTKPEYEALLTKMVKGAVAWRAWQQKEPFVDAIRVDVAGTDTALGLLVRGAPVSQWYQCPTTPAAILYFYDLDKKPRPAERFIARLFGLTPSEARVAALLSNGFSMSEVSKQLTLTESTVRTYSKIVYFKTGVSGQVELVRLIMKSVALLAGSEQPIKTSGK